MNLPFSTNYKDGQLNHFVEKIMASLPSSKPTYYDNRFDEYSDDLIQYGQWIKPLSDKGVRYRPDMKLDNVLPKLHTFRRDENGRWQAGKVIHATLFNRTKFSWQFAIMPCIRVQPVLMTREAHKRMEVRFGFANATPYSTEEELLPIAINDGFENLDQFEEWFLPKPGQWDGRIIHWTQKVY
ncbi:hypothetical protein [Telluribacter humicola]|uniref:hypothetical protein n=1 Tax=Telluribacter humicola TaxID=1720261 RepID=UPI001A968C79|nr:hypothetical protein [Telluribacter humicola]